ncbi:putative nucleotidyltransferase substrate binding domain-containing protein [Desulfocurvibacter africanus]|uniref:putative nucleotidyltransferase substrate binding domain-containing protein n=1 Tax=Desulfocurvibacter africanus TaxID=873 RepID=UPI000412EA4B|nr:putative nucleotidyltransferase substrate binding domain-containing protein [Desulfocurvibacter africanus]
MSEALLTFLERVSPFSDLPPDIRREAAARAAIRHIPAGGRLPSPAREDRQVHVVVSGLFEILCEDQAVDLAVPGDVLGFEAHLSGEELPPLSAQALEDGSVAALPAQTFAGLLALPEAAEHFAWRAARLRFALELAERRAVMPADPLLGRRLADLELRAPLTLGPGLSLAEAAGRLAEAGAASCLLDLGEGSLGILTERDVVRAVAQNAGSRPARDFASSPLVTMDRSRLLVEAFAAMVQKNIRRLVLTGEDGRPRAIVEERDLLTSGGDNPVHTARLIDKAETPAALAAVMERLTAMVARAVAEGLAMEKVGRLTALIADRVLLRAAVLAGDGSGQQAALCALGSEGRREQFLATDQDNAMIVPDGSGEAGVKAAGEFAGRLVAILAEAGLPRCSKGIMADNPAWRMPLSRWRAEIDRLVLKADAEAVLKLSLLADARHILGDAALTEGLRAHLVRKLADAPVLLRYLAREALRFDPPLGFFGGLQVERGGSAHGRLDVKKGGLFPIMQGAKTLALEHGIAETSTFDRLDRLAEAGVLPETLCRDLCEAYEHIQALRVRGQIERLRAGLPPDNAIDPRGLSALERDRLRQCLKLVASFQGLLSEKYGLRLLP